MAIKNKAQIRLYYETHDKSAKDIARHYGISYRTLAHWIKHEQWQKGCALENLQTADINKKMLNKQIGNVLAIESKNIADSLNAGLSGDYANELSADLKEAMLNLASEELLLSAITSQALQKNIIEMCMIAKAELLRILRTRSDEKGDAMIIACAEKVEKMFIEAQSAFYGKQATMAIIDLSKDEVDLNSLSTTELKAQLARIQNKGA